MNNLYQARILFERRDYSGAIKLIKKYLGQNGKEDLNAYHLLAEIYLARKKYKLAEEIYFKAARKNIKIGNYTLACLFLEKILSFNPISVPTYRLLARTCLRFGDTKHSEEYAFKAKRIQAEFKKMSSDFFLDSLLEKR